MLLMFLPAFVPAAHAAGKYPVKSIQLIVPYAPGGGSDITGRIFCDAFKNILPEAMVVSNIAGAGGMNGMSAAARAKPDSYTILWEHPANLAATPVVTKASFRWTDFDIICSPAISDTALIVKKDAPWKDVKEVIKDIQANPKKYKWGVSINSTSHFTFLNIQEKVGKLDVIQVPVTGDKPRIVSMLGGNIDVATVAFSAAKPYIESGDLKILAMVNRERSPFMPGVPTLRELGIDAVYDFMYSAIVPKGAPAEVLKTLADAFEKVAKDPKVQEALKQQYVTPVYLDQKEVTARWAAEAKNYEQLIAKNKMVK
jgi:tripartite-type tricarboxylate transporter receptor subunit TctC